MSDLTGVWFADDVAFYYFYDDGKEVWWAGLSNDGVFDSGIRSTSVFRGLYANSNTVNGQWVQVPRGQTIDLDRVLVRLVHFVLLGARCRKNKMALFRSPDRGRVVVSAPLQTTPRPRLSNALEWNADTIAGAVCHE